MSWLILALIALLCWSGSDFFSKLGSKPDDKLSHWKMVIAVGLVMGVDALIQILSGNVEFTIYAILQYLPASILYIAAMVMGYISLRYVELSLSSPVCNASGAVAAIFCFLFLQESIDGMTLVGVIVVSLGVILLGVVEFTENDEARILRQEKANIKYVKSLPAILLPIAYCLIDAAGTVADTLILETMDEGVANVAYELTFLFLGVCAAIYVFAIKRDRITVPRELPKLAGGVCETAGQIAYIYAIGDFAVGAAPVISAYCMLSLVWGHIFLKERLGWKHWATVGIVFAGILVLGIAEGLAEL